MLLILINLIYFAAALEPEVGNPGLTSQDQGFGAGSVFQDKVGSGFQNLVRSGSGLNQDLKFD